ncbi:hypothetical protein GQ54DRAFT_303150 [Martensiomyces pterosporus]|nr:hypothetical protein GQ54DRAFT_303150 [Martensiomyces pterosporus]
MATTNISTLLLNELQSLSTEARRKHPDIKEAAERVIVILRGIKSTLPAAIAEELARSDEVIRPFVLACKSGNHKLTATSVQCLQQLISHRALSPGSIRETLATLNAVIHQSVDIQVKILQMLLPLVSIYDSVTGEALVDAIHMCFVLQQSRDPIVNNTAAAILRQLVVAVFDRVVAEDKEYNEKNKEGAPGDAEETGAYRDTSEEDMTRKSAKDAYFVLQDLCLLVSDGEPIFIRADAVDKGLVLELIESILANHAKVVARHTAMAQTLRERLSPFIVNFFSEKSTFPLAVRCIRIIWLFIRDLHDDFNTECEIFLSILTKLADPGSLMSASAAPKTRRTSVSSLRPANFLSSGMSTSGGLPLFYRVLAMEVIASTVENADLLHQLYVQYDGRALGDANGQVDTKDKDCHVILDIISVVGKVASERPDIRVNNSDGIPNAFADGSATAADGYRRTGNDGGGSTSHSGVEGSSDTHGQISARGCRMRTEMHKLLDKQDPPSIPEHYLFYLALSALVSLAEGVADYILPKRTATLTCRVSLADAGFRRRAGASQAAAAPTAKNAIEVSEPVLDLAFDSSTVDTRAQGIKDFAAKMWPVLLSAYSFFLGVRLDDSLFNRLMETAKKLAQVSGALDLHEARDALISLLCRSCLPQAAIANHERQLQVGHESKSFGLAAVPESAGEATDDASGDANQAATTAAPFALPLVTNSLAGVQFTMHARQVQCLRVVLSCAQYLASVLGPTWYPVLVTLQQADELLYQSRGMQTSSAGSSGVGAASINSGSGTGGASYSGTGQTRTGSRRGSVSTSSTPAAGSGEDLGRASELRSIQEEYSKLFAVTRAHGSSAFIWVVRALCELGSDLSSVPMRHEFEPKSAEMRSTVSLMHRRMSAVMDRPTFAVEELRSFAVSNIDLLMGASESSAADDSVGSEAWALIMHHLLDTATYLHTPTPIRTQACEAVSDVVLAAMALVTKADGLADIEGAVEETGISHRFVSMVTTGDAQLRILTPLSQMMTGEISITNTGKGRASSSEATESASHGEFGQFIEVRKLALDTLHKLLQASGHSITRAWDVVFDIIQSVVVGSADDKRSAAAEPLSSSNSPQLTRSGGRILVGGATSESRQPGYLIRFVFPCLQLICTDYLADLPAHCMRRCIESLAEFGRQKEDLNISLTAIGQAWALCDFFQGAQQQQSSVPQTASADLVSSQLAQHSESTGGCAGIDSVVGRWWQEDLVGLQDARTRQVLWLLLLHSLASLGRDSRHEVRLGAIQTLFRTLDMHGDTFDVWVWDSIVWCVLTPVLEYSLSERARIFELIRQGKVDLLADEGSLESSSKAQMATKSGVFVEDPSRLYRKQWDETAATAVQGAARVWKDNMVSVIRRIGYSEQAWQIIWQLVSDFLAGAPSQGFTATLPVADKQLDLELPHDYIENLSDSLAKESPEMTSARAYLKTRDSVSTAIECASMLVDIAEQPDPSDPSGDKGGRSADMIMARFWRTTWASWLAMGVQMTSLPEAALLSFNETSEGTVVFGQDVLHSYLQLFAAIFANLHVAEWFSETDCRALLSVTRSVVLFVDAPLYSLDIAELTKVQKQALDTMLQLQQLADKPSNKRSASRNVAPDTAMSLVLGELAVYAVAPYAIQLNGRLRKDKERGDQGGSDRSGGRGSRAADGLAASETATELLCDSAIVHRTINAFSKQIQRLAAHTRPDDSQERASDSGEGKGKRGGKRPHSKYSRRSVPPTLAAFGVAALDRLGALLCSDRLFGSEGQEAVYAVRALLDGAWRDAIVAMGLHLALPLPADSAAAATSASDNSTVGGPSESRQGEAVGWLVRTVPLGMFRLKGATVSTSDGAAGLAGGSSSKVVDALADAWMAVGIVLGSAVGASKDVLETRTIANGHSSGGGKEKEAPFVERGSSSIDGGCMLAAGLQMRVLDAVAQASLEYARPNNVGSAVPGGPKRQPKQPREVASYWDLFVRILEWGSLMAAEPVVLLCADESVSAAPMPTAMYGEFGATAAASGPGSFGLFCANRQALTMACFKWLFHMSSGSQDGAMPLWVSAIAAPTLVRQSRLVLEAFVRDKALLGRSPMPLSRIELLRLILDDLARLACQPGALAEDAEGDVEASGPGVASDFRRHALTGSAAHVFMLYDNLIDLLSVPDPAVLGSVQRCLRRVSAEIVESHQ